MSSDKRETFARFFGGRGSGRATQNHRIENTICPQNKPPSSAESVGGFQLWQVAHHVKQREFDALRGAKAVGFSGGQFCFAVESSTTLADIMPGASSVRFIQNASPAKPVLMRV